MTVVTFGAPEEIKDLCRLHKCRRKNVGQNKKYARIDAKIIPLDQKITTSEGKQIYIGLWRKILYWSVYHLD